MLLFLNSILFSIVRPLRQHLGIYCLNKKKKRKERDAFMETLAVSSLRELSATLQNPSRFLIRFIRAVKESFQGPSFEVGDFQLVFFVANFQCGTVFLSSLFSAVVHTGNMLACAPPKVPNRHSSLVIPTRSFGLGTFQPVAASCLQVGTTSRAGRLRLDPTRLKSKPVTDGCLSDILGEGSDFRSGQQSAFQVRD